MVKMNDISSLFVRTEAMRVSTIVCLMYAFLSVSINAIDRDEWWEVKIAQGLVRGRKDTKENIYEFKNIPYATAPSGEHKFKAPLPAPTWLTPYDAIDKGIICPQINTVIAMYRNLKMQEQCLIANIYVPETNKNNLSVLIVIHGGEFKIGYGDFIMAKHLMKPKDLIVVTFNYRLGIHGFLCLGTDDIPGNAGIKDQIALLRWVQLNIASFGGNPNDITVSGYSAGATSVDLLMISGSAKGLFHRAIIESGPNLAPFTIQWNPLQNAKDHAKSLNFTKTDDIYALEKFYKSLTYEEIMAGPILTQPDSSVLFSPCLEREKRTGMFLTESPLRTLKKGNFQKLPILYGFTNMEGIIRIPLFDTWKDEMNNNFSDFLPADLIFNTEQEKEAVAGKVKSFYFGDKAISNDNILSYVDYFSDINFIYPSLKAVKLYVQAGHREIYLYEYSFVDDDTPVVPYTNVRGATHVAQSSAVYDGKNVTYIFEDDITEEYRIMKKVMRQFWHNFMTKGKPVPKGSRLPAWPAVGSDGARHMSLAQKVELRSKLSEKMFRFWDDIHEQYYREPIPPPKPALLSSCKSMKC